jgi:hypothetical protein
MKNEILPRNAPLTRPWRGACYAVRPVQRRATATLSRRERGDLSGARDLVTSGPASMLGTR